MSGARAIAEDVRAESFEMELKRGQAVRFVVNLNRSRLTAEHVRHHLSRSHPSKLKEVLVVENGLVTRVWP